MTKIRVMTFNTENLLERFNFRKFEKDKLVSLPEADTEAERAELIRTYWNILNDENRVFTALAIREGKPDVVCLQEVENMRALTKFHNGYVSKYGDIEFRHRRLIEGNDRRGIDVAVMSRFKIDSMTSHQEITFDDMGIEPPGGETGGDRVFRRDCLEVVVKKENRLLPVFVCHFKSMAGGRAETRDKRLAEAKTLRKIIEDRFADPADADWLVVGDLNDYTEADGAADNDHGLGPILDDGFSVDLVKNITKPKDRWTHYWVSGQQYRQIDYILASPALAAKNPGVKPGIIRSGQPFRAERYSGNRYPRVGWDRPKASDHCPVFVDLEF